MCRTAVYGSGIDTLSEGDALSFQGCQKEMRKFCGAGNDLKHLKNIANRHANGISIIKAAEIKRDEIATGK